MTKQYLVRRPNSELTHDHQGFLQTIKIGFDCPSFPLKFKNAFFTLNWGQRVLEVYTEHLGYHAFNMRGIRYISLEGISNRNVPRGMFSIELKAKQDEILSDEQWLEAYKAQPWTQEGIISIHEELLFTEGR